MGRCVIGSLVAPPNPKPVPASAQSGNDPSLLGTLTGVLTTFAPDAGEVGLREISNRVDQRLGPFPEFATEIAAGVRSHLAAAS